MSRWAAPDSGKDGTFGYATTLGDAYRTNVPKSGTSADRWHLGGTSIYASATRNVDMVAAFDSSATRATRKKNRPLTRDYASVAIFNSSAAYATQDLGITQRWQKWRFFATKTLHTRIRACARPRAANFQTSATSAVCATPEVIR